MPIRRGYDGSLSLYPKKHPTEASEEMSRGTRRHACKSTLPEDPTHEEAKALDSSKYDVACRQEDKIINAAIEKEKKAKEKKEKKEKKGQHFYTAPSPSQRDSTACVIVEPGRGLR